MTFQDLFKDIPGATDFVGSMPQIWPVSMLQDVYAPFGALHLVGLALMGGAVLLLNLRLLGANPTGQSLPDIERSTRPWLIAGLATVLITGVIIGMLNSYRLYTSVPFFVKIMSLIGACIFSFGVTNVLAKSKARHPSACSWRAALRCCSGCSRSASSMATSCRRRASSTR